MVTSRFVTPFLMTTHSDRQGPVNGPAPPLCSLTSADSASPQTNPRYLRRPAAPGLQDDEGSPPPAGLLELRLRLLLEPIELGSLQERLEPGSHTDEHLERQAEVRMARRKRFDLESGTNRGRSLDQGLTPG